MAFGKPGRPPEDLLLRKREIYVAVSPLIIARGVRRLTMREAAHAACLSVGGLYHYFPSKRDLVLHPLQPESLMRLCDDFHGECEHFALTAPDRYLEVYLDFLAETAMFLRPAVWATLELGSEDFQMGVALGMPMLLEEFTDLLRRALPDASRRNLPALVTAIRRASIGALLDKETTEASLRAELAALIRGHVRAEQPSLVAVRA